MCKGNVLYNVKSPTTEPLYYIHCNSDPSKQPSRPETTPSTLETYLTTETVDSASLAFESIYNIEGCDSLSFGVFSISDCVADDTFKEDLEDTSSFFVDETRDTFDTTTACETTDSWLSDSFCIEIH